MLRSLIGVVAAATLAGCGSPMLSTIATAESTVRDAGITGEWVAQRPMDIRAVISEPSANGPGPYEVRLTVRDQEETKTSLTLEMTLTDIGGARFSDLFLARPERDRLVSTYGFLAVPVHQVMKVQRDGDELRVWSFQGNWLERRAHATEFSRARVAVGGGDVTLVTAPTARLRQMLERHGDDPEAFGECMVFRRAGP